MDDANNPAHAHEGHNSEAANQLRSIVERVERVEEEIKALNSDKSDIYAEAKGNGFDTKIIKKVVALRRKSPSERQEEQALLDLYLSQVGG